MTIKEERLTAEEYIDFLKRMDLGSQYPKERFYDRIPKLVKNVSISLVARNDEGLIVGVLFGLTPCHKHIPTPAPFRGECASCCDSPAQRSH